MLYQNTRKRLRQLADHANRHSRLLPSISQQVDYTLFAQLSFKPMVKLNTGLSAQDQNGLPRNPHAQIKPCSGAASTSAGSTHA